MSSPYDDLPGTSAVAITPSNTVNINPPRAIYVGVFDAWEATPEIAAAKDDDGKAKYPAQPARPAGDRWGLRYYECQAIEAAWVRRELNKLQTLTAQINGNT